MMNRIRIGALAALLLAALVLTSGCLSIFGPNGFLNTGPGSSGSAGQKVTETPAGGPTVKATPTVSPKPTLKITTGRTVTPTKTKCQNCVSGESGSAVPGTT